MVPNVQHVHIINKYNKYQLFSYVLLILKSKHENIFIYTLSCVWMQLKESFNSHSKKKKEKKIQIWVRDKSIAQARLLN